MLRSCRKLSSVVFVNQIVRIGFLIFIFTLLLAGSTTAQTVVTYSFEDVTADGWTSFNGATTPVATNAAAYS